MAEDDMIIESMCVYYFGSGTLLICGPMFHGEFKRNKSSKSLY